VQGGLLWRLLRLDQRSTALELMDTQTLSPDVADRTLRFLEWSNRSLGGEAAVIGQLARWRSTWPTDRPVTVLDVGTGAADIPVAMARWARAAGARLRVTGIDPAPDIIEAARLRVRDEREVAVAQATLADVASAGRRFDYVTASLFLHHVPPSEARDALAAIDRIATRGVVIVDLRRSPGTLVGISLLTWAAGNAIVRHDGPLSVRRAFTLGEFARLAESCGLGYLRARREGRFRLSLSGEKARHV
jgi:hypothetical protein